MLTFGERPDIVARAREAERAGAHVYGLEEVGGTSWLYVSDEPVADRHFPVVETSRFPEHSKWITRSQLATIAVGAGALAAYSGAVSGQPADDDEESEEEVE